MTSFQYRVRFLRLADISIPLVAYDTLSLVICNMNKYQWVIQTQVVQIQTIQIYKMLSESTTIASSKRDCIRFAEGVSVIYWHEAGLVKGCHRLRSCPRTVSNIPERLTSYLFNKLPISTNKLLQRRFQAFKHMTLCNQFVCESCPSE